MTVTYYDLDATNYSRVLNQRWSGHHINHLSESGRDLICDSVYQLYGTRPNGQAYREQRAQLKMDCDYAIWQCTETLGLEWF